MLMTLWTLQQAGVVTDVPAGVWNGIGVVGLVVLLFWMLATGRLATARELREKDRRIAFLEKALTERDKQLSLVMSESIPVTSTVLNALHHALEGGEKP